MNRMNKTLAIILAIILLGYSMHMTYTFAGSNNVAWNSSYDPVTGNSDTVDLPSGCTSYYYNESFYLNIQVGENIFIHDANLYVYKDGSLYHSANAKKELGFSNYVRFWGHPLMNAGVGSYYFYFILTYSTGSLSNSTSTYTTGNYSFAVVDRTPSINASSTNVSLSLAGTKTKTVSFIKSCALSYSYHYSYSKSSSAFSCEWMDWNGDYAPLKITGITACTNEPITISLKRASDNAVMATKTIYVTVSTETYNIRYNANGGTGAPSDQTKVYNETLSLSSVIPVRTGYTFLGWSTSSGASSATYLPGGSYTSNYGTTLYAVWKQTTLSSGAIVTTPITYSGQQYIYKFTPSISGSYVIYSTGNADTKVSLYNSSGSVLSNNDDGGENRNFRLQYNLSSGSTYYYGVQYYSSSSTGSISTIFGPVYVIQYNANGGSEAPSQQSKDYNTSLLLSSFSPAKFFTITYNANGGNVSSASKTVNCTFNSWNTQQNGSGTSYNAGANYTTNANVTLYAQWINPTAGSLATPTRSGYTFDGWYTSTSGGNHVTDAATISDNTTLYAHWTKIPEKYTVTYNANGGSGAPSPQTKTEDAALTLSNTKPTKSYTITYNANGGNVGSASKTVNCTFNSWNTQQNGSGTAYDPGDECTDDADITLYAQWENPVAGELEDPTKDGYVFDGWYTAEDGGEEITESFEVTEDITVYAHWAKELSEFTVSYDANGGDGAPEEQIKTEGTDLTLSGDVPVKEYTISYDLTGGSTENEEKTVGCTFICWNSASDGSGTAYDPGEEYSDDAEVTLYAQWKNPVAGVLEDPIRDGYVFDGWYTAETGGEAITEDFEVSGDITVYAHWIEEPGEFTVSFDANGGDEAPEDQIKTEGMDLTLSEDIPVKEYTIFYDPTGGSTENEEKTVGCTFLDWNCEPDGSGAAYDPGDEYTDDMDVTLYAQWGNPVAGVLEDPTRDGYIFDGWYTAEDGGEEITKSFEVTENITVYAKWVAEEDPSSLAGDINGDGVVNNKDLTRLMKYLSGEDVYVVKKTLDVNGDGICNNKDLTRLMKYLAGEDVKIYYDKNAREFEKIYYVPVRVSTQSEAGTNEQALWQWEESNVSISLNDEKSPERVRSILFDGDGRLLSASGTDTVFEIECGVRYEFNYDDAVLNSIVRTKEPLQQMDNAADYILRQHCCLTKTDYCQSIRLKKTLHFPIF